MCIKLHSLCITLSGLSEVGENLGANPAPPPLPLNALNADFLKPAKEDQVISHELYLANLPTSVAEFHYHW